MEILDIGRLRSARRNRGLKMAQAGAVIGKTKNAIHRYESGITSPRLDDLLTLLAAYKVRARDVLTERI